jgi:hypothetical protein
MQDSPWWWLMRLLALVLLIITTVASTMAYDAASVTGKKGQIILSAVLATYEYREIGNRGHVSDSSQESWFLRDRHGTTIGRMYLTCRWITQQQRFCIGSYRLPLGTITLAGNSSSQFSGTFAVTGGTGRYRGAAGEIQSTTTGSGRMITTIMLV